MQQPGKNLITDIKNKLCPLGCIGDHATFQGSFLMSGVSFSRVSDPFFSAKTLSTWRIILIKMECKLGIFLECRSVDCTHSSHEVIAKFCLVNQDDRKINEID